MAGNIIKLYINKWCVYQHTVKDRVVYVGMGGAARPFQTWGRNYIWKEIIKDSSFGVEIIKWFKTRKAALRHETRMIKKLSPQANINKKFHRINPIIPCSGSYIPLDVEIKLDDYLIDGRQQDIADALKITPGAVHQMVKSKRDIYFVVNKKGGIVRAWEMKPLPARGIK